MTFERGTAISCTRCGNFCERLVPVYKVCEPCLDLVLPQGMRGEISVSTIASGVGHLLRTVGLQSTLILGLAHIPNGIVNVLRMDEELRGLGSLGALVWSPFPFFAGLVVLVLAHQSLRGMPISLRDAAERAASRFMSVFWTNVVSGFFVALWSLLLVFPGLHKLLCYCLAPHIALFESRSGDDAVAASMQRTQPFIGTLYLLGIGSVFLSALGQGGAAGVTYTLGAALTGETATTNPAFFAMAAAAASVVSTGMSLVTLTTLQVIYEQSAIRAADMGLLADYDDA